MKFLFVLNIDLSINGPSVHLMNDIILAGAKQHCSIDVLCFGKGSVSSPYVKYFSLQKKPCKESFLSRYVLLVKSAKRFYKHVKNGTYDAIFLQSSPASFWFTRLFSKFGCPIIYNAQDLFPHNLFFSKQMPGGRLLFLLFNFLEKQSYRKMSKIITISDDMKNTIVRYLCPKESKISVVYNWSYSDDAIVFRQSDHRLSDNILNPSKYNVVYAGNIGKMQNINLIISVAKLLKDIDFVHFTIIGEGVEKDKLMHLSDGLNNISFFEFQSVATSEIVYALADVNIIPLVPKGIYTALPSKSATCLRSGQICLFCIDTESIFAKKISNEDGVFVYNPTDIIGIANLIKLLSSRNHSSFSRLNFIKTNMSSEFNPKRYIDIIKGACDIS
ncbi:MAG: glycosyltransferase family 4 protein [Erysipelotrichaceae bacterium]|nr:glycosyltransferase family 4 protein [Erysipelotrichaceae bacterium]